MALISPLMTRCFTVFVQRFTMPFVHDCSDDYFDATCRYVERFDKPEVLLMMARGYLAR